MKQPLNRFLLLQPAWLPTLLFIPLLYALGWLAAVPLTLLGLPAHQVSLTGTVLSFALFLLVIPRWAAVRWAAKQPWAALGITRAGCNGRPAPAKALLSGLLIATGLLTLITVIVLSGGWGRWLGHIDVHQLGNAVLLCLGVGFAEELIFRGWLWTELNQIIGSRQGFFAQASLFSLVHTRFNLGRSAMLGLLSGLLLLGLVLASKRQDERGSLWGCIGLHGGLVSGWFLLQNGLLEFDPTAPSWLIGPGGSQANPLGGIVAIGTLTIMLLIKPFLEQNQENPDREP